MSDPFELAAEAFAEFKDKHPGDSIELTEMEAEAIKKQQGWTDEQLRLWLNDEEPLPAVKITCDVCSGLGTYAIVDRWGSHRYDIACPECHGGGVTAPVDE